MQRIIVCLHGWGGSKESFTELKAALKDLNIAVLTPDLPGFGEASDPPTPWHVADYATWVRDWITHELAKFPEANNTIELLGHSHGGRISIMLCHWQSAGKTLPFNITHVYLCAAAGIKHPRHLKRIFGLTLAKSGKFFLQIPGLNTLAPLARKLLYKLVRVHDYEKANPLMQTTLQYVTAEDLRLLLPTITTPCDLFWGKQDGMTPFSDALYMQTHIPNATLHAYEGVRHGVHRDKAIEIAEVIMQQ